MVLDYSGGGGADGVQSASRFPGDADGSGFAHARRNRDCASMDEHAIPHAYGSPYRHRYPHADAHANQHRECYADSDGYRHRDGYRSAHRDGYANANRDLYAD